jgi:hypothetical protein
MNIAMLTTWNSACGIAEYSRNLVIELLKLGHRVFLFTNNLGLIEPWFPEQSNLFNTVAFGVKFFGETPTFKELEIIRALKDFERNYGPLDVFHVQYHVSLYEAKGFNTLMKNLKCKKIITRHDSATNMKYNLEVFEKTIVHNTSVINPFSKDLGHRYIPFPTIELMPGVFSFGMGRNDYDFIQNACEEIGVDFKYQDSKKAGWLDEDELFYRMAMADAIVLWYNDVQLEGQSAALRTAISSCRPVIVNKVGWFSDAPGFVYKAENKNELQILLDEILHLRYIRDNSFENCALKHIEIYKESNE